MLEDRPDLLNGVERRRGRGHEAHFHTQLVYHYLSLLGIVGSMVVADDDRIAEIIVLRDMLDEVDEALTAGGFSHDVR